MYHTWSKYIVECHKKMYHRQQNQCFMHDTCLIYYPCSGCLAAKCSMYTSLGLGNILLQPHLSGSDNTVIARLPTTNCPAGNGLVIWEEGSSFDYLRRICKLFHTIADDLRNKYLLMKNTIYSEYIDCIYLIKLHYRK